jgi:hypothetical protein
MKRMLVIIGLTAALLAACAGAPGPASTRGTASSRGTVTGRFVLEGGPIGPGGRQPGPRPIPGTVQFSDGHHRLVLARVGSSGNFSVSLPAGRYAVSGHSPRVIEVSNGASREAPCSQSLSVTVTPRHTTRVSLTCIVP